MSLKKVNLFPCLPTAIVFTHEMINYYYFKIKIVQFIIVHMNITLSKTRNIISLNTAQKYSIQEVIVKAGI